MKMKNGIMMICLVLGSWTAMAQHDHTTPSMPDKTTQATAAFKDAALGATFEAYDQLKNALVTSNAEDAKKAADNLVVAAQSVKGATALKEASAKLAASSDLREQRTLFSGVSNEMAPLVRDGKLAGGMLYIDYCPMANGNKGGYWLSTKEEIRNPYFGDRMLKCGSVKEVIQ